VGNAPVYSLNSERFDKIIQYTIQVVAARDAIETKIQSSDKRKRLFQILTESKRFKACQEPNLRRQSPRELVIVWKIKKNDTVHSSSDDSQRGK
jgi:hypothetical protein